jgi:hypothetical protein
MTGHRRHRRREHHRANYNQNEWISISEIKRIAANFVQQKQHANRNEYRGTHQPANRTPWTSAMIFPGHAVTGPRADCGTSTIRQ